MRKAKIYYKKDFAGYLTETDDGEYVFVYEDDYVQNHENQFSLAYTTTIKIKLT